LYDEGTDVTICGLWNVYFIIPIKKLDYNFLFEIISSPVGGLNIAGHCFLEKIQHSDADLMKLRVQRKLQN